MKPSLLPGLLQDPLVLAALVVGGVLMLAVAFKMTKFILKALCVLVCLAAAAGSVWYFFLRGH